jgi:hypothetical protein
MITTHARITLHHLLDEMPVGMGDEALANWLEVLSSSYCLDNYGRQTLRQMYEVLNYQKD